MRLQWVCLVALIGIGPAQAQSTCRPFLVRDGFRETTLRGFLSVAHSTDTAYNQVNRLVFSPLGDDIPNFGYAPRQHWIRCCIRNMGVRPQELIFGIDFAHIDDLALYVLDSARGTLLHQWTHLGRHTPVAQRPVVNRAFAFPFRIQPGQTLTLYGRFVRQRSVLLLPIKLMAVDQFYSAGFSFDLAMYMGLGILLIACLVSIVLWLTTRQWALLYYALFALAYGVATLSLEGVWGQYVQNLPWLDENTHLVMFALCAFAQTQLVMSFTGNIDDFPRLSYSSVQGIAWLSIGLALYLLVTPFSYTNSSLLSGWALLTQLVLFSLIGWAVWHRRSGATLLLVSFLPVLFIGVWFAFTILFNLPRNWSFYQLAYLTPFWQLLIMGVGLANRLVHEQHRALLAVGQLQRERAEAIIHTEETERQRIAADLHDDLGGTLATICRQLSDVRKGLPDSPTTRRLDQIAPLLQKSTHDLRTIAHNLMPPEFARLGLRHTLEQLVKSQPDHNPYFSFVVAGTERRLSYTTELNLYRIVSELIQNIHKHAKARQAAIQLLYHDDHLTISLEDDGIGNQNEQVNSGSGLKNINLRAEYIGAKLWRESNETGTLVMLDVSYVISSDAAKPISTLPSVAG
jgi:signal transduction histidine kinase